MKADRRNIHLQRVLIFIVVTKKGWYWAYQDIKEILEQNGFDMDVVVIKEGANNG